MVIDHCLRTFRERNLLGRVVHATCMAHDRHRDMVIVNSQSTPRISNRPEKTHRLPPSRTLKSCFGILDNNNIF